MCGLYVCFVVLHCQCPIINISIFHHYHYFFLQLGDNDATHNLQEDPNAMKMSQGFTEDGKLIRTADLLGLKSDDSD